MKKCSKCKAEQPEENFNKNKTMSRGVSYTCKSCNKEYSKKYRESRPEYFKEYNRKYREENLESIIKYRQENKDTQKNRNKEYYSRNPAYHKARTKKWYQENKEKVIVRSKKIYEEKKDYYKRKGTEYKKERRAKDPVYKLSCNIRTLIGQSFTNKGLKKNTKTENILGCSFEEFKIHIEKQFVGGMNWDNRSKWHIDHIIPLASGKTEEEVIKLNHYTNLRPLWAEDNMKKGARLNYG